MNHNIYRSEIENNVLEINYDNYTTFSAFNYNNLQLIKLTWCTNL